MSTTIDIMVYLLKHYPHKDELSNARLTKLIYLCDWKHALGWDHQITSISWYYNYYGPFVDDIHKIAEDTPTIFKIMLTVNAYGDPKRLIKLVSNDVECRLQADEQVTVDYIIEATKQLNWADFMRLVYSTYPIISSDKYVGLDLVRKAEEYRKFLATRTKSHDRTTTVQTEED